MDLVILSRLQFATATMFHFLFVPAHARAFHYDCDNGKQICRNRFFIKNKDFFKAWFSSAIVILGTLFFGIIRLYPNMLPSNINTDFSVTAYNASSSPLTLKIMLVVVILFIPAVIAYQAWAHYLFRGKVTKEDLAYDESY